MEDAKGVEGMVFGVPKCSGSVCGLPGMGGRAGPDVDTGDERMSTRVRSGSDGVRWVQSVIGRHVGA